MTLEWHTNCAQRIGNASEFRKHSLDRIAKILNQWNEITNLAFYKTTLNKWFQLKVTNPYKNDPIVKGMSAADWQGCSQCGDNYNVIFRSNSYVASGNIGFPQYAVPPPVAFPTKCTVLVCGRVNAGKSSFIRALFADHLHLPTREMPCTARFVRIVYSEKPLERLFDESNECVYEEKLVDGRPTLRFIDLDENEKNDKSHLNYFVEIGIPADMLKNGLQIIDCPGLDENEIMTDGFFDRLGYFQPDLLLYLFDNNRTFSEADAFYLDRIWSSVEYCRDKTILLANKLDVDFDAQIFDQGNTSDSELSSENGSCCSSTQLDTNIPQKTSCMHFFDKKTTLTKVRRFYVGFESSNLFGLSTGKLLDYFCDPCESLQPFLDQFNEFVKEFTRLIKSPSLDVFNISRLLSKIKYLEIVFGDGFSTTKGKNELVETLKKDRVTKSKYDATIFTKFKRAFIENWKLDELVSTVLPNVVEMTLKPKKQLDYATTFLANRCSDIVIYCLRQLHRVDVQHSKLYSCIFDFKFLSKLCHDYFDDIKDEYKSKESIQRFDLNHYIMYLKRSPNLAEYLEKSLRSKADTSLAKHFKKYEKWVQDLEKDIKSITRQEKLHENLCLFYFRLQSLLLSFNNADIFQRFQSDDIGIIDDKEYDLQHIIIQNEHVSVVICSASGDLLTLAKELYVSAQVYKKCLIYARETLLHVNEICPLHQIAFYDFTFVHYNESQCQFQVISLPLSCNRLIDQKGLSLEQVSHYLFEVLKNISIIHKCTKSKRLFNFFRIDIPALNANGDVKLDLYGKCIPNLPITFPTNDSTSDETPSHTLVPRFHYNPFLGHTVAQDIYNFGWFAWWMLRGVSLPMECSLEDRIPMPFRNQIPGDENWDSLGLNSALGSHSLPRWMKECLDDITSVNLKQLIHACWTIKVNDKVKHIYKKLEKCSHEHKGFASKTSCTIS